MAIEVTQEPPSSEPSERCCFCWQRTRFWYEPKDVAVCPICAEASNPDDVPAKVAWCEEHARRYPRSPWAPRW